MPIYFNSEHFKVAILYKQQDCEQNGVFVFGEQSLLRGLFEKIKSDKPNLKFLNRELVASFSDKKGCCLFLPMNKDLEDKVIEEYKDDIAATTKYFKELIKSTVEPIEIEYVDCEGPYTGGAFFDEETSTFFIKIDNWKNLNFAIKRKFVYAFLDIMSKAAEIRIIGDGGVTGGIDGIKKSYAIIITADGFGWKLAGTPKKELLDKLYAQYQETVENYTEADANKYKISDNLITKINWLSSLEVFRW